jgi:hypothetical protein
MPETGGAVLKVNDQTISVSGSWTEYELEYNLEADGNLTVGFEYSNLASNWIAIDDFSFVYGGEWAKYQSDKEALKHKKAYDEALAAANAALSNTDYANVTGSELVALQTEVGKAEPTTADGYDAAVEALNSATSAYIAAKTNYDVLVAEVAYAKTLGITTADDYAATSTSTAATALANTQNLKVAEYQFINENYPNDVSSLLGTWTRGNYDITKGTRSARGK